MRSSRILGCVAIGFFLAAPFVISPAHAQLTGATNVVNQTATAAGVSAQTDLYTIIGRGINIFLGFLGIIFLVLMLYAGYTWMTASGDAEKVKKAQTTVRNAVVGLFIIAISFVLTGFILNWLSGGGQGGDLGALTPTPTQPFGLPKNRAGGLGTVIEYHTPARNATDVPRNTPIIITFKEAVSVDSFIKEWSADNTRTGLNDEAVKIYRTKEGVSKALTSAEVTVTFTADHKTFVLRPVSPNGLGSSSAVVMYTVELASGAKGILKDKASKPTSVFGGSSGLGYSWQFETSKEMDLTPPRVVAVIPSQGDKYGRNIVVQIIFDKVMDPTTITGHTSAGFMNLQVLSNDEGKEPTNAVPGEFRVSNLGRTVEFIPEASCGEVSINSCGRAIYCLPGNSSIKVLAKAARLTATPPLAVLSGNGYDGVVSAVGNSLDGNGDGKAQGPGDGPEKDDYSWRFGTTNDIKLTPPQVISVIPGSNPRNKSTSNIPLAAPFKVTFDTLLQSSTINSDTAKIEAYGFDEKDPDTFWFTAGTELLKSDGVTPIDPSKGDVANKESIVLNHRPFVKSTYPNLDYYDPTVLSGVQDAYQNCFAPADRCGDLRSLEAKNPNCCDSQPSVYTCRVAVCKKQSRPTERCQEILKTAN